MPHAPPLGALLRQYSAGSALTCDPVDQGLLNRGYRLCTTRGRYFLKHHFDPETAAPEAIARQHRATQRLADLGVPVAPPLPAHDGRTVAVIGGHAYALHPWIDGRHRHGAQLTTAQCARLGALLGVVHASLERVMPVGRATPPHRAPSRTPGARVEEPHAPGAPVTTGPLTTTDPSVTDPLTTTSPSVPTGTGAQSRPSPHTRTSPSGPARGDAAPTPLSPSPSSTTSSRACAGTGPPTRSTNWPGTGCWSGGRCWSSTWGGGLRTAAPWDGCTATSTPSTCSTGVTRPPRSSTGTGSA